MTSRSDRVLRNGSRLVLHSSRECRVWLTALVLASSSLSAPAAEPQARETPGFKASTADGRTLEVVAVSYMAAYGNKWWRPTGELLTPPYPVDLRSALTWIDTSPYRESGNDERRRSWVAVVMKTTGIEPHSWEVSRDDFVHSGGGGFIWAGNMFRCYAVSLYHDMARRPATLDICTKCTKTTNGLVAPRDWVTGAECIVRNRLSTARSTGTDRMFLFSCCDVNDPLLSHWRSDGRDTRVRVDVHEFLADHLWRIRAVDVTGEIRKPIGHSWGTRTVFGHKSFTTFKNLNLADVHSVRLEVLPFDEVHFQSISLIPGRRVVGKSATRKWTAADVCEKVIATAATLKRDCRVYVTGEGFTRTAVEDIELTSLTIANLRALLRRNGINPVGKAVAVCYGSADENDHLSETFNLELADGANPLKDEVVDASLLGLQVSSDAVSRFVIYLSSRRRTYELFDSIQECFSWFSETDEPTFAKRRWGSDSTLEAPVAARTEDQKALWRLWGDVKQSIESANSGRLASQVNPDSQQALEERLALLHASFGAKSKLRVKTMLIHGDNALIVAQPPRKELPASASAKVTLYSPFKTLVLQVQRRENLWLVRDIAEQTVDQTLITLCDWFAHVPAEKVKVTAGTTDKSVGTPAPGAVADAWRMKFHGGNWWYWTRDNRWMRHENGRWVDYLPPARAATRGAK